MASGRIHRGLEVLQEGGLLNLNRAVFNNLAPRYIGKVLSCNDLYGQNVFLMDWDVLILLDTCRVDALQAVANEYEFITDVSSIRSVGGTSAEWMANTFTQKHTETINKTAYIVNNAFASKLFSENGYSLPEIPFCSWKTVEENDFGKLEHIWKYEPKGEGGEIGHLMGHTPPRPVTDRAISAIRNSDYERVILHYNQPHKPYTADAINEGRALEEHEHFPFDYLRRGGSKDTVFNSYLNNLRYVLDDVKLLLQNIDANRVAISADHGEAFGEYCTYEHPFGSLNPVVRLVPWVITSGEDNKTYTPEFDHIENPDRDIDELLNALGYK